MTTPRLSVKTVQTGYTSIQAILTLTSSSATFSEAEQYSIRRTQGKLSEELSENRAYKGKQLKTPTELAVLQEGDTIVKHHRMYPIESNFKFFYKLNLGTAELDDIAFSSEGKALVEILIPFEILMPQKADQEDHLSEKNISDDGLHQQPATAIPNRFVDSPDSVVISPQKAALEAINEATNGEWSRAMQEIDIDTLERLLNRSQESKT